MLRCSVSGIDKVQRQVDCPCYSLTRAGVSKYWLHFGDPVCIPEKQLVWNSLISFFSCIHKLWSLSFCVYVISRDCIRLVLFYGFYFILLSSFSGWKKIISCGFLKAQQGLVAGLLFGHRITLRLGCILCLMRCLVLYSFQIKTTWRGLLLVCKQFTSITVYRSTYKAVTFESNLMNYWRCQSFSMINIRINIKNWKKIKVETYILTYT